MRTVRLVVGHKPFIRGQKVQVAWEVEQGLFCRGMNLCDPMNWQAEVTAGPIPRQDVEEYVPEPPEKTTAEKLKGLMK